MVGLMKSVMVPLAMAAFLTFGAAPDATRAATIGGGESASPAATAAVCLNIGGASRVINGNHPTGTTAGTTWLAARVQSTFLPPSTPITTDPWAQIGQNHAYWISTDPTHFPAGTFWAGQWYRSTLIAFDNHGVAYHRIQWLIQFADGHQEYRYTIWTFC